MSPQEMRGWTIILFMALALLLVFTFEHTWPLRATAITLIFGALALAFVPHKKDHKPHD